MKDIEFLGDSLDRLRDFPRDARADAGYQLQLVQDGKNPADWKPFPTIGPGVREIRISEDGNAYRVMYVTNIGDCVYVLHAFEKKTQKTPQRDIDLAKRRFKEIGK